MRQIKSIPALRSFIRNKLAIVSNRVPVFVVDDSSFSEPLAPIVIGRPCGYSRELKRNIAGNQCAVVGSRWVQRHYTEYGLVGEYEVRQGDGNDGEYRMGTIETTDAYAALTLASIRGMIHRPHDVVISRDIDGDNHSAHVASYVAPIYGDACRWCASATFQGYCMDDIDPQYLTNIVTALHDSLFPLTTV